MKEIIMKWALKNAIDYKGKASIKAVVPKVIGENPEVRKNMKALMEEITKIVEEVNNLSVEEQKEKLMKIAPELLEKKEKKSKLKELPNVEKGNFITRLPPEPGKYPHAGHAIGFYINYLYAKQYNGKLILRFEDTNPQKVQEIYYDGFREDLKNIGIKWDEEILESNNISLYYEYCEKLLDSNNAYACTCSQEEIQQNRRQQKECSCRSRKIDENKDIWKKMLKDAKEGEYVIRLKGDMAGKDPLLRDPFLFRVIDEEHPIQGKKYRVYPSYDFAVAIEDGLTVTHVLRGAEMLQRTPLQNYIRGLFDIKNPELIHYSRINITGGITSGRKLREWIKEEKTTWDDPRLITIRALLRRGIVPETFKKMAYKVGLSLSETNVAYETIAAENRKIIDNQAKRCFLITDPIKVTVKNAPEKTIKIATHPDRPKETRTIETADVFWISKSDAKKDTIRLKDLYNIKITKAGKEAEAEYAGEKLVREMNKVQWVPDNYIKVKLLIPVNMNEIEEKICFGEKNMENFHVGDIIQMERVGFGRIDKKKPYTIIFTHK